MKTKTTPLLLFALLLSIGLTSCKNKSEKPVEAEIKKIVNTEEDKDTIEVSSETEQKKIPDSFKSRLRPNEELHLGKIYTDTVTFLSYDDNYDYWYFLAQKNKDTIQIIYTVDIPINELVKGDSITLKWELKLLQEAGDEEITYLKPYLISFNKISSRKPVNKNVTILRRETLYDEVLKTNINTIVLNKAYQKNSTDPERAALGYVATFVGNECEWNGGSPNENRSNLDCKLLTYLDLGYQCSNQHLGFLNQWFSKDSVVLNKLKRCPTIPNTATIQSTFDEILLETNTQKQTIVIRYKISVLNTRENSVTRYTKTATFTYNSEGIILTDLEERANNSFVVSCGSGCAMTYTKHKIVTTNNSSEITFKVALFINEVLSKEYEETYSYTCNPSNNNAEIQLKGAANNTIENQHPEIQKQLKLYIQQLCKN